MNKKAKIQYLIVDTSAFIKNAALQDIGDNILTEQAVVNEITSKRQLRRLIVLPYDLKIQEVFTENIKFVTEFSKKTGDYTSLSATDIKVIALTYQLEKEKVGTIHLKNAPTIPRTINFSANKKSEDNPKPPVGFYIPKENRKIGSNANVETYLCDAEETDIKKNIYIKDDLALKGIKNAAKTKQSASDIYDVYLDKSESNYEIASEESKTEDLSERFATLACNLRDFEIENENESKVVMDDILVPVSIIKYEDEQGDIEFIEDEDYDDSDDDDGWITPGNLINIKKQMDSEILEEKVATVACLTMDFAMQNVLMQMGLNIAALDGRVIKQMRTFIFRCYACFKTTSIMTKVFCPHCGNKTLKKVEVVLDENGKQQIHINFRKPLSTKGKRFSLPTPKGGKHSNNPILCEDQPIPDQRPTHLARIKNNPLDDDYVAGFSPFIMRDVNSKSAMLGIKLNGAIKYWMRKNPNESRRKRK